MCVCVGWGLGEGGGRWGTRGGDIPQSVSQKNESEKNVEILGVRVYVLARWCVRRQQQHAAKQHQHGSGLVSLAQSGELRSAICRRLLLLLLMLAAPANPRNVVALTRCYIVS